MTKRQLRDTLRRAVASLSPESVAAQSALVCDTVVALGAFAAARDVCVYLSMPNEVQAREILRASFASGKGVYVPKVTGRSSSDLRMLRVASLEEVDALPRNAWGIPEPPLTDGDAARDDLLDDGACGIVVVPGCGFDAQCRRLGHGKGYYDSFLGRLRERYDARSVPFPLLVGVCLREQLVDAIPVTEYDVPVDLVVTPDAALRAP